MLTGNILFYSKKGKLGEMTTLCHSFVIRCHSLHQSLSLVVPIFVIRIHSLHHSLYHLSTDECFHKRSFDILGRDFLNTRLEVISL